MLLGEAAPGEGEDEVVAAGLVEEGFDAFANGFGGADDGDLALLSEVEVAGEADGPNPEAAPEVGDVVVVAFEGGCGDGVGVGVIVGDEDVPVCADDGFGDLGVGVERIAAVLFAKGGIGLDGAFDEFVGAAGDPVHAALGGELHVGHVADTDPERGVGLLEGSKLHGNVDEVVVAAAEGEALVAEAVHDDLEGLEVDLLGAEEGDVVVGDFKGGDATPDADLETSVAEIVEHADFVDKAERVVEGEEVDEGAEAEVGGALGESGEEGGGGGGHAEAGLVVLGEVVGVEAGLVGGGEKLEAAFVGIGKGFVSSLEVVEEAEGTFRHGRILSLWLVRQGV